MDQQVPADASLEYKLSPCRLGCGLAMYVGRRVPLPPSPLPPPFLPKQFVTEPEPRTLVVCLLDSQSVPVCVVYLSRVCLHLHPTPMCLPVAKGCVLPVWREAAGLALFFDASYRTLLHTHTGIIHTPSICNLYISIYV